MKAKTQKNFIKKFLFRQTLSNKSSKTNLINKTLIWILACFQMNQRNQIEYMTLPFVSICVYATINIRNSVRIFKNYIMLELNLFLRSMTFKFNSYYWKIKEWFHYIMRAFPSHEKQAWHTFFRNCISIIVNLVFFLPQHWLEKSLLMKKN
jgi:hypothetical protein